MNAPIWLKQYVHIIRVWLMCVFGFVALVLPLAVLIALFSRIVAIPPEHTSGWWWLGDLVGGFFWYAGVYQFAKSKGF